ncbi:MAG: aminotransferase class I/II-fold pyridoxal phosphate-dependent enzyme, partial [Methyloligellaceae bacterium]
MNEKGNRYQVWLEKRERDGLARGLRSLGRAGTVAITVDGKSYTNFSGNDYLGLSSHPALIERSGEWAREWGAGSAASRLVTGNLAPFAAIEAKVAALKGSEAALLMASGFQANASVLQALFDKTVL